MLLRTRAGISHILGIGKLAELWPGLGQLGSLSVSWLAWLIQMAGFQERLGTGTQLFMTSLLAKANHRIRPD